MTEDVYGWPIKITFTFDMWYVRHYLWKRLAQICIKLASKWTTLIEFQQHRHWQNVGYMRKQFYHQSYSMW